MSAPVSIALVALVVGCANVHEADVDTAPVDAFVVDAFGLDANERDAFMLDANEQDASAPDAFSADAREVIDAGFGCDYACQFGSFCLGESLCAGAGVDCSDPAWDCLYPCMEIGERGCVDYASRFGACVSCVADAG